MRNALRVLATIVAAASMILSVTALSTTTAEAHSATAEFSHDALSDYASCPSGYSRVYGDGGRGCRPTGYEVIGGDAELCAEAFGTIVFGICSYDSANFCNHYYSMLVGSAGLCVAPVLISPEGYAEHYGEPYLDLATLVCIESPFVQEHAKGLSVASRFWVDYVQYEVAMGGAACSFNCMEGFDANCDGRIGDFCAVELDIYKVDDVGKCLGLDSSAD